jgi:hypothetical protein
MPPNGPAIKRAERIETALWAVLAKEPACRVGVLSKELIKVSWYFSRKVVPVARQVWHARLNGVSRAGVFAVMVKSLLREGAVAVQGF